jgi:hypothetical protein
LQVEFPRKPHQSTMCAPEPFAAEIGTFATDVPSQSSATDFIASFQDVHSLADAVQPPRGTEAGQA